MTISEFKKVARLLKTVYAEIQRQALEDGYDITSPEYDELINMVRERTLAKRGYTLDEYRQAKAEYEASRTPAKTDIDAVLEKVTQLKGEKGDQGERGERGEKGDKGDTGRDGRDGKDGKPGKDGRDGKNGRDGVDGHDGEDGFIDEATIGYLEEKIDSVAKSIPASQDLTDFYKEMDVIQEAIKGMPDFRKLGMGLQAQMDTKIEGVNVTRIIYSVTEPTGQPVGTVWISPA